MSTCVVQRQISISNRFEAICCSVDFLRSDWNIASDSERCEIGDYCQNRECVLDPKFLDIVVTTADIENPFSPTRLTSPAQKLGAPNIRLFCVGEIGRDKSFRVTLPC